MTATVAGIHLSGTHAARPAGNTVPDGSLYSCSDHALVYQSNFVGNSWATWATLGVGSAVANLWTMNKSASQTLTNNTLTQITFDTTVSDGGGSVIDLANDKFETPATGLYLVFCTWLWETTIPAQGGTYISVKVGATEKLPILRGQAATASMVADRGLAGAGSLSLTAGDDVTMWIHPGAVTGVTARGNAATHLATTFTLVRIA